MMQNGGPVQQRLNYNLISGAIHDNGAAGGAYQYPTANQQQMPSTLAGSASKDNLFNRQRGSLSNAGGHLLHGGSLTPAPAALQTSYQAQYNGGAQPQATQQTNSANQLAINAYINAAAQRDGGGFNTARDYQSQGQEQPKPGRTPSGLDYDALDFTPVQVGTGGNAPRNARNQPAGISRTQQDVVTHNLVAPPDEDQARAARRQPAVGGAVGAAGNKLLMQQSQGGMPNGGVPQQQHAQQPLTGPADEPVEPSQHHGGSPARAPFE